MPYRVLDIDLDRPVPPVTLGPSENGLAVLARRDGRPLAFWMEPLAAGSAVSAQALGARAAAEAGEGWVRAAAMDELGFPDGPARAPTVTVAVCTRDRPERLARCLRSIAALQIPTAAPPPEVLVVDNAPPDDRTRAVAEAAGVGYVREPLAGLDFARNKALAEASGDWVAFMDDDVVADAGWLAGLHGALAVHPDAAAVTGLVLPFALDTEAQVLFERAGGFRRGFKPIRYHGPTHPGNPLYPAGAGIFGAGANMAFRRDVLVELGGFDEALDTGPPLPGGGDLDAFYRLVRSGRPLVYWPPALVFHEHRRDLDGLRSQYHSWGAGFMAFLAKTWASDRQERPKLRRMRSWWLRNQGRQVAKSVLGRHALPPRMLLAELAGGLRGMAGEYARSRRRVAAIRDDAAARHAAGPA